jgi:hypothetical protein
MRPVTLGIIVEELPSPKASAIKVYFHKLRLQVVLQFAEYLSIEIYNHNLAKESLSQVCNLKFYSNGHKSVLSL